MKGIVGWGGECVEMKGVYRGYCGGVGWGMLIGMFCVGNDEVWYVV